MPWYFPGMTQVCHVCGEMVDHDKTRCPNCSAPAHWNMMASPWVMGGLVFVIVLLLCVIIADRFGNLGILAWVLDQIRPIGK